jgi:hypothetical protein
MRDECRERERASEWRKNRLALGRIYMLLVCNLWISSGLAPWQSIIGITKMINVANLFFCSKFIKFN